MPNNAFDLARSLQTEIAAAYAIHIDDGQAAAMAAELASYGALTASLGDRLGFAEQPALFAAQLDADAEKQP